MPGGVPGAHQRTMYALFVVLTTTSHVFRCACGSDALFASYTCPALFDTVTVIGCELLLPCCLSSIEYGTLTNDALRGFAFSHALSAVEVA